MRTIRSAIKRMKADALKAYFAADGDVDGVSEIMEFDDWWVRFIKVCESNQTCGGPLIDESKVLRELRGD